MSLLLVLKNWRKNLAWKVEITKSAEKIINKLDKNIKKRISIFIKKVASDNPRLKGKVLKGNKKDLWRYRVGDYRIICRIEDEVITIVVLAVGHRGDIYK